MIFPQRFKSESEAQTQKIAFEFAAILKPGDVVALYGNLGSGKTFFVKSICEFFHVEAPVTSPTYVIEHEYEPEKTDFSIKHFDLYRLKDEKSAREIGIDDCLWDPGTICLIEWPERIESLLRNNFYRIDLTALQENHREINIRRIV